MTLIYSESSRQREQDRMDRFQIVSSIVVGLFPARDRIPSRVTTKHVRIYTGIEETVHEDQVYSFFFFPKKLDRYITIISDN